MEIVYSLCILLAIAIASGIVFFLLIKNKANSNHYKEDLSNYELESNSTLSLYLKDLCDAIYNDINTAYLISYELFKKSITADVYNAANEKFDNEGSSWTNISEALYGKITKEKFANFVLAILNSKEFDDYLSNEYVKIVVANIAEIEKNEDSAIEYNKNFSNDLEGEPILHPKESNSDNTESDDIHETSIEELSSTGTIEDVEE